MEVLNNFPEYKMVLHPGGCATYKIPIDPDQAWMFVQPARKPGKVYDDYCSKGKVSVQAKISQDEDVFECFKDPSDCSSKSCLGDIHKIVDSKATGQLNVHLEVCNDQASLNDAAIWEINFSSSNDSNKLEAVFEDDSRLRLRNTQDVPEYNTQLTLVQ